MSETLIQILEYLGIAGGGVLGYKLIDFLLIKYQIKNAKTESTGAEFKSYAEDANSFMAQLSLMTEHLTKAREIVINKELELLTSNSKNKAMINVLRRHAMTCTASENDLMADLELIEKTYSDE